MIVFSRELYVCRLSAASFSALQEVVREGELRFVAAGKEELSQLAGALPTTKLQEFSTRLGAGHAWIAGVLQSRIVTYSWLHTEEEFDYPYLPGCRFRLPADAAYGYDAYTFPEYRGRGFRRLSAAAEISHAHALGRASCAGVFVASALPGARRSFETVGIAVEPVWHVMLRPGKRVAFEPLTRGDSIQPSAAPEAAAMSPV